MVLTINHSLREKGNYWMKPYELKEIQGSLISWFDENQRCLPWRKHYEPYQVWISEIMLQQTRVQTMLP